VVAHGKGNSIENKHFEYLFFDELVDMLHIKVIKNRSLSLEREMEGEAYVG